jgi:hypothetical protein
MIAHIAFDAQMWLVRLHRLHVETVATRAVAGAHSIFNLDLDVKTRAALRAFLMAFEARWETALVDFTRLITAVECEVPWALEKNTPVYTLMEEIRGLQASIRAMDKSEEHALMGAPTNHC